MAIPKEKSELQNAINESYVKLRAEFENIPIEFENNKELAGHAKNTLISINNLLAYLIGWGQLVLKWQERKDKGLAVDFPEAGFKWNELGQLAQNFYNDYEGYEFERTVKKLDGTVNEILALVATKTNEELYKNDWYNKWTLGRMIQLNTSSPIKNARARIRKWKKAKQLKKPSCQQP
jgi:hypothetical protein